MQNAISSLAILVFAGVMNACFTLPMKFTRRWAWENTWLAWTTFALLVLPFFVAWGSIPHLGDLYGSSSSGVLFEVISFGVGWGVAQAFFGLAVEAIGIALTFSLVLGTSAAVGTLIPLLRLHPQQLNTSAGRGALAGVGLVLVGVLVCAIAGRQREKALRIHGAKQKNITLGLMLAILSGLGASFVNLGLAFGAPLAESARELGASMLSAPNAVWLPLLAAGAAPNIAFCLWLLAKNRTAGKFLVGGVGHWSLAAAMAGCWFGSALLYGFATVEMGAWGPILGWPIFMSLIVITASLVGMFTNEWKNCGRVSVYTQWAGVALLVFAVFVLSITSRT